MRPAARFSVHSSAKVRQEEARRRAAALSAEADRIAAAASWWRRLICKVGPHRAQPTGLMGQAPDGALYRLMICRRCGRRWGELGPEVSP